MELLQGEERLPTRAPLRRRAHPRVPLAGRPTLALLISQVCPPGYSSSSFSPSSRWCAECAASSVARHLQDAPSLRSVKGGRDSASSWKKGCRRARLYFRGFVWICVAWRRAQKCPWLSAPSHAETQCACVFSCVACWECRDVSQLSVR